VPNSAVTRFYSLAVDDAEDDGCPDLPDGECREVPENAARLIGSFTLTKLGDRVVDPKTTLPWLMHAVGAPSFGINLLVPIREAGSLLPQALLVPWVRRFALRKYVWIIGSIGQALAVLAIAASATLWSGTVAAAAMLFWLAMFAISRSLSSISAKDVIGKTIPKGQRGSITGIAASISGVIAIAAGGAIALLGGNTESTLLAAIVAGAAALWVAAGRVFASIGEHRSSHDDTTGAEPIVSMLRRDRQFRRFIEARSLLLVTALSPPLVIAMAASASATLGGLGPFVIAAGTASFIGSPVWGRLSDHSSRSVMAAAALCGGVIVFVFLLARQLVGDPLWLTVTTYFLLAVAHAGARMGRKTYVVDMGTGDQRTNYVAASNTVIGVVLLGTGAVSTLTGVVGNQWTLGGLALAGVAGAFAARGLPDVERA
jgi:hypothetical protein